MPIFKTFHSQIDSGEEENRSLSNRSHNRTKVKGSAGRVKNKNTRLGKKSGISLTSAKRLIEECGLHQTPAQSLSRTRGCRLDLVLSRCLALWFERAAAFRAYGDRDL